MTKDEILSMDAGPEMDGLVARHVMGWCPHEWVETTPTQKVDACPKCGLTPTVILSVADRTWHCKVCGDDVKAYRPPERNSVFNTLEHERYEEYARWSPSTSIADAWEVVERMMSIGWWSTLNYQTMIWKEAWDKPGFLVTLRWCGDTGRNLMDNHTGSADTAPLAICRAALMATQSDYAPEQGIPTEPPAEYPTKEMPQPNTTKR